MNVFSVMALGIISAILAVTVRAYRPEYGMLLGIAAGLVIMLFVAEGIGDVVAEVKNIVDETGIDVGYFKIILKVTGVSYITQFGVETARDAGENAIASKLDAAGKAAVLLLTVPVVSGFIRVIGDMLEKL